MNNSPTISHLKEQATAEQFTITINDQPHTYPNNKDGKRKAILDGLHAIEPLTVDEDSYLSSHTALQIVATILYPSGIQTKAAYETVCSVTDRACAHIGYGNETSLEPPTVPFSQRGQYRRRYSPVDPQLITNELTRAPLSHQRPRRELPCQALWNLAATAVFNRHWYQLSPSQQTLIQHQVDTLASEADWQKEEPDEEGDPYYFLPIEPDLEAAQRQLTALLQRSNGRPLPVRTVHAQARRAAYARSFPNTELAEHLATAIAHQLQAHGYSPKPVHNRYQPQIVELPAEMHPTLKEQLTQLTAVSTKRGDALLLADVYTIIKELTAVETISEWQSDQLLEQGILPQLLRQLGYDSSPRWCQPHQFQPPRKEYEGQEVLFKEIRLHNTPAQRLSLAKGLGVLAPTIVLDEHKHTLIYFEMLGSKQAVKANWAALVGSGKSHVIDGHTIQLEGMKHHIKAQATLPCGWSNQILIHKQASLQELNPKEPFYLLDDGQQPIPPLFYAMLNKCLALPLLPDWAHYLWQQGRLAHGHSANLIHLLNNGQGQGYAAWRVTPTLSRWQPLIEAGIKNKEIHF